MDSSMVGLVGVLILVVLLFMGMHVGITMLVVGFFGYAYIVNFTGALGVLKTTFFTISSSYALTVIPLFVLMGQFAYYSGLSKNLYATSHKWLGHLPGGLAVATIGACAFFASICGSSTATAATFGTVSLPEMRKYGYDDGLASGAIVAGGTLGILIPPSVGFILYGVITEQSIGKLFAAGFLPGIILALCYVAVVIFLVKRNPSLAPACQSYSWKDRIVSLKDVLPIFILFVIVIGGMFAGFFTANEAAGIGAFGAFLYLGWTKQMNMGNITKSLKDTVQTTAMIFTIIIGAYVFGYFLAVTKIPMNLAAFITGLGINRFIIIAIILVMYAFLGCLMDSLAMVLLTVPIFYPVILGLGFDPIWFGVLMVMVMEMGMITPPVGMNIYVMKGIAGDSLSMGKIFRGVGPHVIAIIIALIIMTAFPKLSLIIPNLIYK